MNKKEIIASWRKFRILSSNSFVKNLSKQILRLERENEKLKDKNKALEMYADLAEEKVDESCKEYADKMNYAKAIIKDLLDNSDEYAKQRASDFLKEE